jgi:hypothetical protein
MTSHTPTAFLLALFLVGCYASEGGAALGGAARRGFRGVAATSAGCASATD